MAFESTKFCKQKHKANSIHPVWQEGFHPQIIYTDEVLKQKIEYIHYNPVKRGLVNKPGHWKYSTACDYYLKQHGLIKVDRHFID